MDKLYVKYREVVLIQQNTVKWKDISINTGGIQNMLQDIKVSKTAGGFPYESRNDHDANRFIYWRIVHDVLQISEISLNVNLRNNNVRLSFDESPILAVDIMKNDNFGITLLVATVTSIHRINLNPAKAQSQTTDHCQESILSNITKELVTDARTFYAIGTDIGPNVPNAACCYSTSDNVAYFAISITNNLFLFKMNGTGNVKVIELKNQTIPRFLFNITDVFRGKHLNDSQFATSITFGEIQGQVFLYALYRDNAVRVWTDTGTCVATEYNSKYSDSKTPGSQSNILRKSNSLLCMFLSYTDSSEFIILRPTIDNVGNVVLPQENVILSPEYDLIDFKLSDTSIWALWCTSEGDVQISTYMFQNNENEFWFPVALEVSEDKRTINLESGMDARNHYCRQIFNPSKFQHETILKALLMFNRSFTYSENFISAPVLKRHVCQAIDAEVHNEKKQKQLTVEEYVQISSKIWEKFYSCCEQYHLAANQPIGLLILEEVNAVCVIKNKQLSFLRPTDNLEVSFLSGNCFNMITSDDKLSEDMGNLMSILKSIEQNLPDHDKTDFDKKLFQLVSPSNIVSSILNLSDLLKTANILAKIQSMYDLPRAIMLVLNILKLDEANITGDYRERFTFNSRTPFGSSIGIQLVTETVKQTTHLRYMITRNLLILQQILIDNFILNCNATELVRSRCVPDTVIFLQSYYVMMWISESIVDYTLLKSNFQRNSLNLIINQDESNVMEYISLLHLFIASKGFKSTLQNTDVQQYSNNYDWSHILLGISTAISRYIWSVSGDFLFGEWLLESNLHLFIQEYVRLLNSWCEWNSCSRHYMLGRSYLSNGENTKALDLFLETVKGAAVEPYLKHIFRTSTDAPSTNEDILSSFYLKIIRLFEQYNAYDCVHIVAQIALGSTEKNSLQAMFQSISFNSHMSLGHYEEAYHSLIYNCEPTRRKDCLRQLVWCLFDVKRFDLLKEFPYIGLEMDFQNIIETRARSIEIMENDQYDFLYSFHIMNGNMRKAAHIAYEKALRCYAEYNTLKYVEMRYESLLCCISTLNLVDEEYAWIVKPPIKHNIVYDRKNDNEKNTEIVVLTLKDIKKELLITEAILSVEGSDSDLKSILDMGQEEIIVLLTNNRMYTNAFKFAAGFDMKLSCIYKSLTYACIHSENWHWLDKNNLMDIQTSKNCSSTAWKFLQYCLNRETTEKHACFVTVLQQILHNKNFTPQWIEDWFDKNDPTTQLRLLIAYGRLEESYEKAIVFLHSFINRKVNPLKMTAFPLTVIDALSYEMKKHNKYKDEKFTELDELLQYYVRIMN